MIYGKPSTKYDAEIGVNVHPENANDCRYELVYRYFNIDGTGINLPEVTVESYAYKRIRMILETTTVNKAEGGMNVLCSGTVMK